MALVLLCAASTAIAESPRGEAPSICLNSVGYLPSAPKRASAAGGAGRAFQVIRLSDGAAVFAGKLSSAATNVDTQESLSTADFSSLTAPGRYRLQVESGETSPSFRIGADVYLEPFRTSVRAMYLWRCGAAVAGEHAGHTYRHEACHLDDAELDFVGGAGPRRVSPGGWHDAGDYNKYVVNAGVTVGVMLRAWEDFAPRIERIALDLPNSGGTLPAYLAEVKWELDWLLTMQADDGSAYHKVSTRDFGGFVLPEAEREPRYFVPWSSAATADFVAMMALAARHYERYDRPFAERCLRAARKSHAFLHAHPENHHADQRGFKTGGYQTHDADDRLWADAELWEATGDGAALAALESRLKGPGGATIDVDWDWGNVKNLGLLTYLASRRPGRDAALVEAVRGSVIAVADAHVAAAAAHGYGRPMGTTYYWGCNGTTARQTVVLQAAFRLTGDQRYRDAQLDALNHLFGRNYYGRSFVTGLGHRPPLHPHDRRSGADDVADPWPGYLVGGPHRTATDWRDVQEDFRTNEIAINWNGALIYALASQLPEGG